MKEKLEALRDKLLNDAEQHTGFGFIDVVYDHVKQLDALIATLPTDAVGASREEILFPMVWDRDVEELNTEIFRFWVTRDDALMAMGRYAYLQKIYNDGWIKTSERLPRLDDASHDGKVLAWSMFSNSHVLQDWRYINVNDYPFWSKLLNP